MKETNITNKIKLGQSIKDELIIDCHTHCGMSLPPVYAPHSSDAEFIDYMSSIGIDIICTSHGLALGSDFKTGNDEVFKLMGRYPDKIIGEAVINPNYPSEVQNELERCFNNGFKILKLHPKVHNYRPDGINYKPVYEFCNDNKLVILSHTFGSPDFLEDMAKTYKNVTYIIGHGHEKGYEGLLRRYENVFQCISDSNEFGDIERLTKEGGSDKLLFGTDALYFDPGFALGVLVYADISDDDKRKILGKNMLEILKDKKIIRSP